MRARFPSADALVCAAACGGKDRGNSASPSRVVTPVALAISVQGEGTVKGASGVLTHAVDENGGPARQRISPGAGFASGRATDRKYINYSISRRTRRLE